MHQSDISAYGKSIHDVRAHPFTQLPQVYKLIKTVESQLKELLNEEILRSRTDIYRNITATDLLVLGILKRVHHCFCLSLIAGLLQGLRLVQRLCSLQMNVLAVCPSTSKT